MNTVREKCDLCDLIEAVRLTEVSLSAQPFDRKMGSLPIVIKVSMVSTSDDEEEYGRN